MSQENVELMRGLYYAFGRGDVEAVLGPMDEGIEWNEAENFIYADRNPYVGPQAVLEGVFARLRVALAGFGGAFAAASRSASSLAMRSAFRRAVLSSTALAWAS